MQPTLLRRIACVVVPAVQMQALLRQHPAWRRCPVVVVAADKPQAAILQHNGAAAAWQIRVGMPLQAAHALAPAQLQVAVADPAGEIAVQRQLWATLLALTPSVTPDKQMAEVLWLDPDGLGHLYPSLQAWAEAVRQAVAACGYVAHVVVGFNRCLALALARHAGGCHVLASPHEEATLAHQVPLAALQVSAALQAAMQPLGIVTLGDLLQLDAASVRQRLGAEAAGLHARAKQGACQGPPAPLLPEVRHAATQDFEPAEPDVHRLLFAFKALLAPLLRRLQACGLAVQSLQVTLRPERYAPIDMALTPAVPSEDAVALADLFYLHISAQPPPAAICHMAIDAEAAMRPRQQAELAGPGLATTPTRDLAQAAGALARLQAALGAQAVTCAKLCPSHLPEACFVWQPTAVVALPQPAGSRLGPSFAEGPMLVRAVRPCPSPWPHHKFVAVQSRGPYRIQQRWWQACVERDYFYVYLQNGRIIWLFCDLRQRRWYAHGEID